jgi:hypothetical protein
VISTDAHSINDIKNLKFGVGIARRGRVQRGQVLNTLESEDFIEALSLVNDPTYQLRIASKLQGPGPAKMK